MSDAPIKRVGEFSVEKLLLPDKKNLSVAYAARSGSGKTFHLTKMVESAVKNPSFKNTRFVYCSIKHEDYFNQSKDNPPVNSVTDALENMREKKVTVFYPPEPEFYEQDIDILIDGIFDMKDANPEHSFTIIIDDANVLKGFDSRGVPSPSVKKLIITGRSMNIKGCFCLHRLSNLPRIMNGNLSGMVVMNISQIDTEYTYKLFGIDLEKEIGELGDYRWLWVDLFTDQIERFAPLSE